MRIRDVKVYNFGKLQEREYRFSPGINVIYGANETGKSTLHAFLLAMLFGMDKGRGRIANNDYRRYEPWHAPAYYSGALRFVVGEKPFYLERNFYHKEKREILRNEADGEELSVAYGDLSMLLGGINKEIYENTYDIPQTGAVTGGELSKVLAEYLSDAAEGGGGAVHVTQAHAILAAKRKERQAELNQLQNEKEAQKSALQLEQTLVRQDVERLRADIAAARESLKQTMEESSADYPAGAEEAKHMEGHPENVPTDGSSGRKAIFWGVMIAVLAVAALLLNHGIKAAETYSEALFFSLQGIFLAGSAGGILCAVTAFRKSRKKVKPEPQQREDTGKETARQMLAMLEENFSEKETRCYNITEQLEQLDKQTGQEREMIEDIRALELADSEIARIAGEYCEELEDGLNSEVSRYVSAITGGRYDSVRINEKGNLMVLADGKEILPESLSRGTLEQFYLALRLAVGDIVMREETMPICLDEAFVLYDDRRLEQALKVLAAMDRQILLFTCQKREMDILNQLRVDYHRIDL